MTTSLRNHDHIYRLLLIRHGYTDWNRQQLFQGASDVPLNEIGRSQAKLVAQHLAGRKIGAIVASDLSRARETAAAIAGHTKLPVSLSTNWREINFGRFEGFTFRQVQEKFPDDWAAWIADKENAPPGGERISDVLIRVRHGIAELPQIDDYIALVAHGGVLQLLLCELIGLATERYWTFKLKNTSVSELILYREGPIVEYLNDTRHLPAGLLT